MATSKFIIKAKKLNKNGETTIYVQYTHEAKTLLVSTGLKVDPKYWDADKGKYRRSYDSKLKVENEALLSQKMEEVDKAAKTLKLAGVNPTTQEVKKKINQKPPTKKSPTPKKEATLSFFKLYEKFIEANRTSKGEGTVKVYISTRNRLLEFEKMRKSEITFKQINREFYDEFCHFMFEHLEISSNTAGKHIKTLKTFLNYVSDLGHPIPPAYHKFKVIREEVEIIYLTQEELTQLVAFDLEKNTRLRHVRDAFVFCCYTGLRFSDMQTLEPSQIKGDWMLVRTRKTKDSLRIPLLPQAREILNRYEGQFQTSLPSISNQKTNAYLKEIGQLAGLDRPVTTVQYRGSTRIEQTFPKYEKLTSHVARRTFVTLALEKGMRPEVVKKITGHKTLKAMEPYIKIVDGVVGEEMMKAWV